ncbi:MAG: hypothetical protein IKQ71_10915 [Lachnospiraceae bacterium]|nr:hypothetical protein [Lachnospiraceae bacterium]
MPTNEKEINNYLFDQLDLVEEALKLAEEENATKTIEFLKTRKMKIERKLYQKPPLVRESMALYET